MAFEPVQTLVLAGQRAGVTDSLCEAFGVEYKVQTPIAGKPMLTWVEEALVAVGLQKPYLISGFPEAGPDWNDAGSGAGPADSALIALEHADMPCLMTTGDHPLLTAEMITSFISKSQDTQADFCVGFANEPTIKAEYPDTKRTYLRFSDVAVSGCNLFYIANKNGLKALEFWKEAQHLRKNPLKLARKIGLGLGVRYATGKLSIEGAFEEASRKIGITAEPVFLPFAEAAIDVDKPSDHVLVEKILKARSSVAGS